MGKVNREEKKKIFQEAGPQNKQQIHYTQNPCCDFFTIQLFLPLGQIRKGGKRWKRKRVI